MASRKAASRRAKIATSVAERPPRPPARRCGDPGLSYFCAFVGERDSEGKRAPADLRLIRRIGVVKMLTERDAQIVDWLARIGAASAAHVSERFGIAQRVAYRRLASLAELGLVEHRMILHGWPGLYMATLEGLRSQGLGQLRAFRLSAAGFEHAWQVATVAVALHFELAGWHMLGEREIRARELEDQKPFASARVGERAGKPVLHRPDLALVSPSDRVVAIEVERSIKAPGRLRAICRAWARARHVSHVYYLATPNAGRAVSRAVGAVRAEDRVAVLAAADVPGLATRELAREEGQHARTL